MELKNNRILQKTLELVKYFAVPIGIYLLLTVLMPEKIFLNNIDYLFVQAVMPAVLAWGASFNMTAGHSDFSLGASALFASIVGGNLAMKLNMGPLGLLIFCPLAGMVCSGLTGGIFILLKIPCLIVSIGVMLIMESVSSMLFNGGVMLTPDYIIFGSTGPTLLFGAVVFAIAYYLFNFRVIGYHINALRGNPTVAKMCGLNVDKTRFLCFLCVGFFVGMYAALSLGTSGVAKPVNAMGTMRTAFNAIMCFIVGTSAGKKLNPIIATVLGALYMQLVQLVLTAINCPSVFSQAIIASFVLSVMLVSSVNENNQRRKLHKQMFEKAMAEEQLA